MQIQSKNVYVDDFIKQMEKERKSQYPKSDKKRNRHCVYLSPHERAGTDR